MFKLIIDQTQFDALEEGHKALYKKDEESGMYRLDVDPADIPDVGGLKKKVDELLNEKKEEKRRREEAEREAAKKNGDVAALEASWQTRLDTEVGAANSTNQKLTAQLQALTVGRAATELAAELAVVTNGVSSAKVLLPHIERRLSMETTADGEVKVRVLDSAGKPSALTLDQLKDEFKNDPVFAPMIQASKANGSGADGGKNNNGGGGATKFADMTEAQRTELHRKDPAEYKRQLAAHKASQR